MELYEIIMTAYPELKDKNPLELTQIYKLRNDSDGMGDYVEEWNYSQPLPEGMKVGK